MKCWTHWRDVRPEEWRWPHFSPQELACRGTGRLCVDEDALDRLEDLRAAVGRPIIVNSAYRSPEHNRAVGGAPSSQHLQARAYDCRMDNHDPAEFIAAARLAGFRGIGTYPRQGFIHVDTGPTRTWGDPFPTRVATPDFAEAPREEEPAARIRDDREAVGTGVGAAGVVASGGAVVSGIGDLDPVAQVVAVAGVVLALLALAYIFRRRLARLAK